VQGLPGTPLAATAPSGLTIVVFGAVAFSILMCVAFLLTRGPSDSMFDQIGSGGISREGDYGAEAPAGDGLAAPAEQEREVRQMLSARSERLVRRGEPALDIDAEVARLLAPAEGPGRDAALIAEVRQMVLARNERRQRKGEAPLDVDAEIARTLDELGP
jgi:hypothetical protein